MNGTSIPTPNRTKSSNSITSTKKLPKERSPEQESKPNKKETTTVQTHENLLTEEYQYKRIKHLY